MILEKTIESFSIEDQLSLKNLYKGVYLLKLNGQNINAIKKIIID